MARAKMGAIVTEINGKLGGHTFRNVKGKTIISTKSEGQAKSKAALNNRLPQLRALISGWASFTTSERLAWSLAAQNFKFAGHYGEQKFLSGRELYIKLQGNQIVVSGASLNPGNLDSQINFGSVASLFVGTFGPELITNGDFSVGTGWSIPAQFAIVGGQLVATGASINNWLTQTAIEPVLIGSTVRFKYDVISNNLIGSKILQVGAANVVTDIFPNTFVYDSDVIGSQSQNYIVPATNPTDPKTVLAFRLSSLSTGGTAIFDNFSLKKVTGFTAILNFTAVIPSTFVLVQAELIKSDVIAPTFKRRQIIAYQDMTASTSIDLSAAIAAKFPNIAEGQTLRLYISYQNASGFRTKQEVIETIVQE